MNIFISGPPGIGKTTVIKKVMTLLKEKGFKAGGMLCPEIRKNGKRLGFEIIDVLTRERGVLSHINQSFGPRIGKYTVNLQDLSRIGVNAIKTAIDQADYIVIDELGPMELQGIDFQQTVTRALNSSKPVLGIVHWKLRHSIIHIIKNRKDVIIKEITLQNRDSIHLFILTTLLKTLKKTQ